MKVCNIMAAALLTAAPAGAAVGGGAVRLAGVGDQLYRCQRDGSAFAWSFQRPDAELHDVGGANVVQHGAGPHWTAADGSTVYGTVVTTIPSPDPGAIPWLVLRADRHDGAGWLDGVAFILRTATRGGLPPAGGCDAQSLGTEYRSHYTADYTFVPAPPVGLVQ